MLNKTFPVPRPRESEENKPLVDKFRVLYTSELSDKALNRMQTELGTDWDLRQIVTLRSHTDLVPSFKIVWIRRS